MKKILGPTLHGHGPFTMCSLISVMVDNCEDSDEVKLIANATGVVRA